MGFPLLHGASSPPTHPCLSHQLPRFQHTPVPGNPKVEAAVKRLVWILFKKFSTSKYKTKKATVQVGKY